MTNFDPYADLRAAIEARQREANAEQAYLEEMRAKADKVAREVMDELGLKPQNIYGGGYCRFNMAIFRVIEGTSLERLIFRVEYCTKCEGEIFTAWGVYPNLENIGHMLEDPNWTSHECIGGGRAPINKFFELFRRKK